MKIVVIMFAIAMLPVIAYVISEVKKYFRGK